MANVVVVLAFLTLVCRHCVSKNILEIGVLLSGSGGGGWGAGRTILAVEMAVEHVNKDSNILEHFNLVPQHYETDCVPKVAVESFVEMLGSKPDVPFIIGGSCSGPSELLSMVSPSWNVVMISPSADDSSILDDTEIFPNFFRTVTPSYIKYTHAIISVCQHFGWKRLGLMFAKDNFELLAIMRDMMEENGLEVFPASLNNDAEFHLHNFVDHHIRIIYVSGVRESVSLACSAYAMGLYGQRYVWIGQLAVCLLLRESDNMDLLRTHVESTNCTLQQVRMVFQYAICIGPHSATVGRENETTISGFTVGELLTRLDQRLKVDDRPYIWGGELYAPQAYDAVWAAALALNETSMGVAQFSYGEGADIATDLKDILYNLSFTGMSGEVVFSQTGSRVGGRAMISQLVDGNVLDVVMNDAFDKTWSWVSQGGFIMPGGIVPNDRRTERISEVFVSTRLQMVLTILACLGFIYGLLLLTLNIRFRSKRIIRLSSPAVNNVIACGSLLCFTAVIFFGVDHNMWEDDSAMNIVCMARAWLLSIGFTLTFGGLFVKTWRVYIIFSKTTKRGMVIKDRHLFLLLLCGVIVDVVILSIWQRNDPLVVNTYNLPPQVNEDLDLTVFPFTRQCQSDTMYTYVGMIYIFKGVLLMYGAFLAYETRKVKIVHLNDSKIIGVAIYNVFILCAIGAPLVAFIENQKTLVFALVGFFVTFGTFLVLSLVFIPKMVRLMKADTDIHISTMPSQGGAGSRQSTQVGAEVSELQVRLAEMTEEREKWRHDAATVVDLVKDLDGAVMQQVKRILEKYNPNEVT